MTKDKTITRLAAVQALYLYEINDRQATQAVDNIKDYYIKHKPLEEYEPLSTEKMKLIDKSFLNKLFTKTIENLEEIDDKITKLLTKHENVSQMGSIVLAILQVGICELLYFPTPYKVVIDEYVTMARDFYTASEVSFINSILDKIASQRQKNE